MTAKTAWFVFLLFVSGTNVLCLPASAQSLDFHLSWGRLGDLDSEFRSPQMLYATDERVYVADGQNNRVQVFTTEGKFVSKWGTSGAGPGEFDSVVGIARSETGDLYVSDAGNNRVQVFDGSGQFLSEWGTFGHGPGEFFIPGPIAIDSHGDVYVADQGNQRIQKFTARGDFILSWGESGTGAGEFLRPEGIAIDENDDLYIADFHAHQVQKFDSGGRFLLRFGSRGDGPGELLRPVGVAVGKHGGIYVMDSDHHRIHVFSPGGEFRFYYRERAGHPGALAYPEGISINPRGQVFVADTVRHRVVRLGRPDLRFPTMKPKRKWGEHGEGPGQFLWVAGISADNTEERIYVADAGGDRIQVFTPTGQFLQQWGQRGSRQGSFREPSDLDVGPEGFVFVCDTENHRIQKFTPEGELVLIFGRPGSGQGTLATPNGLVVADNGNIYVIDSGHHRIQMFDPGGNYVLQWGTRGSGVGQFVSPKDIAIAPDGTVVVTDTGTRRVQRFDAEGTFLNWWGPGPGNTEPPGLTSPMGLEIDARGQVYVSDWRRERVYAFNLNGDPLFEWGGGGFADGRFEGPYRMDSAQSGNVYVVDSYHHRVQVFQFHEPRPSGVGFDGAGSFDLPGAAEPEFQLSVMAEAEPFGLVAATESKPGTGASQLVLSRDEIRAYPNPTSAGAVFVIPDDAGIANTSSSRTLQLFNATGRLVRSLPIPPVESSIHWDGRDGSGQELSPGVYFYRFAGDTVHRGRLVRLRSAAYSRR